MLFFYSLFDSINLFWNEEENRKKKTPQTCFCSKVNGDKWSHCANKIKETVTVGEFELFLLS